MTALAYQKQLRYTIKYALSHCMDGFVAQSKNGFQEPDYTAGIVHSLPSRLNGRFGLTVGGCFIHQSPRVSYQHPQLGSKSCELGDLLLVCRTRSSMGQFTNAALFQLKMANAATVTIASQSREDAQLYVYTNWPQFDWNAYRSGLGRQQYDICPKSVSPAARYLFVDKGPYPQFDTAEPARTMCTIGDEFAQYIFDMVRCRTGRLLSDETKCRKGGWSNLIWDILREMADPKTAVYNRSNISKQKEPRYQGDSLLGQIAASGVRGDLKVSSNGEITRTSLEADANGCEVDHFGVVVIDQEIR